MSCSRRTVILFAVCALALSLGVFFGRHFLAERIYLLWHDAYPLRIASPAPHRQATALSPYGPGFERELVDAFCARNQCRPVWTEVNSREEGLDKLRAGQVDMVVGFGGDAADDGDILGGREYAHFRPIKVRGVAQVSEGAPGVESAIERTVRSLSDWPLVSAAMDFGEQDEMDAVLLDPASYALWLPLMSELSTEEEDRTISYRWFWRSDIRQAEALAAFWEDETTAALTGELVERYYAFLPRRALPGEIMDLADMLESRLPKYQEVITRAARENDIPPLLLVAVIYQESRFDPDAVSATKVRGIMQLTRVTADMLGVDRLDPEQCIMGGAKYLGDLWKKTEARAKTPWDRWYMALASYNQGPGSLAGAIRIAREKGMKGTTWAELKKSYPLLVNSRGNEAVRYVERVRYYHFILHGLATLAPAEAEHLATLLAAGVSFPAASDGI